MKTREINNKHYIDAKVVMLATKEKSSLYLSNFGSKLELILSPYQNYNTPQHLYITSNEEIKEGDWYLNGNYKYQADRHYQKANNDKKIIATTDKSLQKHFKELSEYNGQYTSNSFPEPSKEFIQAFIENYNNGKVIEDVLVEIQLHCDECDNTGQLDSGIGPVDCDKCYYKLPNKPYKLRLKDNTIIIKKKEENPITLDEMYSNMQYYMEYCQSKGYVTPQDWIENNKHF